MKPTEQDYDYLIDQLSNSMEFYTSKENFVEELSSETSLDTDDLKTIWSGYLAMDAKTAFDMNKYDWYEWIKNLIN